ncbi:hypothetical protein BGZ76_004558, partial [Entomortierella beljakovae]
MVSAAFGVVRETGEGSYEDAIAGTVDGYATSAHAELCGLIAAVLVSPKEVPIDIYIDNSSVVGNFEIL